MYASTGIAVLTMAGLTAFHVHVHGVSYIGVQQARLFSDAIKQAHAADLDTADCRVSWPYDSYVAYRKADAELRLERGLTENERALPSREEYDAAHQQKDCTSEAMTP